MGSWRWVATEKTSASRWARSRWEVTSCTWNSELRTQVLARVQSQSESLGRKMGLSGPGCWLSCGGAGSEKWVQYHPGSEQWAHPAQYPPRIRAMGPSSLVAPRDQCNGPIQPHIPPVDPFTHWIRAMGPLGLCSAWHTRALPTIIIVPFAMVEPSCSLAAGGPRWLRRGEQRNPSPGWPRGRPPRWVSGAAGTGARRCTAGDHSLQWWECLPGACNLLDRCSLSVRQSRGGSVPRSQGCELPFSMSRQATHTARTQR